MTQMKVRSVWDDEKEGNETVTNCHQLKTDITDTEQLFRLVQSIPSAKAVLFPRRFVAS
jgi:hypothetical protein